MPILNRALHTETVEEIQWKEHDDCVFQIYPVQILHLNCQVSRVIPIQAQKEDKSVHKTGNSNK